MSETKNSGLPCFALGLTDGIQCEVMRRLGKKTKKPSGADTARGEHTTRNGLEYGTYWICRAAVIFYSHRGDGTVSTSDLVSEQQKCDMFMDRE